MAVYIPLASIAPSRHDNSYILSIVPTYANGLAAITSASEVLLLDRQNLANSTGNFFNNVPEGTNCGILGDPQGQSIICAGSTGTIATFDVRTKDRTSLIKLDRAVTAVSCVGSHILVGTEYKSQQAIVSLWDARQNRQIWQNAENNDEITVVDVHPDKPNIVLAGSDDGLVSIYDSNISDEDESLLQVINHGPIHKAGFLGSERVFALSSDQNFAIHSVATAGDEQDPEPTIIGDLRPIVPCQYVIDVLKSGLDHIIAAGTNMEGAHVDFIKVENATNVHINPQLGLNSKITLQSGHGEEIVRSIFIDDQTGTIFTAGEDGYVRASGPSPHQESVKSSKVTPKTTRKISDNRFKPY